MASNMLPIENASHLGKLIDEIEKLKPLKRMEHLRYLAHENLFFFCFDVLQYKDIDPVLHWDMAKQWQLGHRFNLFLSPRGSFKTTIWTIAGSLWEIIRNPNVRILITNATLTNAMAIMKAIKEHLMYNERLRAYFPSSCPKLTGSKRTEFGTNTEFTIPNRTKVMKEATVEVGSVEGNLVSKHYDIHIGDDLINLQNTSTKDQIDKVEEFHRAALSLLEPRISREYLIGTIWHWDDLYCRIMNDSDSDRYVYRRSILEPDESGELKSIFPSRFSVEEIDSIKKKQKASMFSMQYMNVPVAEEDQAFREDMMEEYEQDSYFYTDIYPYLDKVMVVDPACSTAIHADYTGIVVVGSDYDDDTYVLQATQHKLSVLDLINKIFSVYEKWKPRIIGIESFAWQKTLSVFIKEEMKRRKLLIPIQELKYDNQRSKEARIMGIQPRVEHREFYLTKDMHDLKSQMLRFPKAKNDDILDALAHTEELRRTGSKAKAREQYQGERMADLMKRIRVGKNQARKIGGHRRGYD